MKIESQCLHSIILIVSLFSSEALLARQPISFEFKGFELIADNAQSVTMTNGPYFLTVRALEDWQSTATNTNPQLSTGFYTNLHLVDGDNTNGDRLTFSLNEDFYLRGYQVGACSTGSTLDDNSIKIDLPGGVVSQTISGLATLGNGDHDFETTVQQTLVRAGELVTLTSLGINDGDGAYRWSQLHIEVVPEPSTYALLMAVCALGAGIMRHRRRKSHSRSNF